MYRKSTCTTLFCKTPCKVCARALRTRFPVRDTMQCRHCLTKISQSFLMPCHVHCSSSTLMDPLTLLWSIVPQCQAIKSFSFSSEAFAVIRMRLFLCHTCCSFSHCSSLGRACLSVLGTSEHLPSKAMENYLLLVQVSDCPSLSSCTLPSGASDRGSV